MTRVTAPGAAMTGATAGVRQVVALARVLTGATAVARPGPAAVPVPEADQEAVVAVHVPEAATGLSVLNVPARRSANQRRCRTSRC